MSISVGSNYQYPWPQQPSQNAGANQTGGIAQSSQWPASISGSSSSSTSAANSSSPTLSNGFLHSLLNLAGLGPSASAPAADLNSGGSAGGWASVPYEPFTTCLQDASFTSNPATNSASSSGAADVSAAIEALQKDLSALASNLFSGGSPCSTSASAASSTPSIGALQSDLQSFFEALQAQIPDGLTSLAPAASASSVASNSTSSSDPASLSAAIDALQQDFNRLADFSSSGSSSTSASSASSTSPLGSHPDNLWSDLRSFVDALQGQTDQASAWTAALVPSATPAASEWASATTTTTSTGPGVRHYRQGQASAVNPDDGTSANS